MNKPTRSEIERTLLGDQRETPRRNNRSLEIPVRDQEQTHRRKTVIGGNLEGVSKTVPKRNYYPWIIAISVVILSGLVFIIPEFFNDAPKISQEKTQIEEDKLYENRIEESTNAIDTITDGTVYNGSSENGFTVANDRNRVAEFRESEEKLLQLNELNEKALSAIESGNFTKPINQSALKYYQEMLSLDENNVSATDGINTMLSSLGQAGAKQLEKNDFESAKMTLQTLSEIDIESEEYFDLSESIEEAELTAENKIREEKINALIDKSKQALDKDQLVTPKNDNVALYLNQILEIDPDNQTARQGIEQISKQFAEQAEQHILNREWEDAETEIAKLKIANKDSILADFLKNRLEKAKKQPEPATEVTNQLAENGSQENSQSTNINNKNPETNFPVPTNSIDIQPKPENIDNTIPFANRQDSPAPADELSIAANSLPQNRNINGSAPVRDLVAEQKEAEIEASMAARNAQRRQLNTGLKAYYSGEYVSAFSNLEPLAKNNVTRAMVRVGYMYHFGRGVTENRNTGLQLLQSALPDLVKRAEANEAWAQSDLGSLYEDGLVVNQSNSTAISWYRKAAAQNYAGAQTNLGNMYFFGKGVEQSQDEAIKWYRLAALEGDAIAKQNLIQLGAVQF